MDNKLRKLHEATGKNQMAGQKGHLNISKIMNDVSVHVPPKAIVPGATMPLNAKGYVAGGVGGQDKKGRVASTSGKGKIQGGTGPQRKGQ